MPRLTLIAPDGTHRLTIAAGDSLREALDATELRVRAACGGNGSCGACLVRWIEGEVSRPTAAEYLKLGPEERAAGWRLACQLRLTGDATLALDHPAPPSQWRSIAELPPPIGRLPELEQHIYGLAVDLGTTHIRLSLLDRKSGRRIASRRGPNPQQVHGADVLNRLDAALGSERKAAELAKLARTAIVQALRDVLARDCGEVTPMMAEIGAALVVGNTAMLALLAQQGVAELLAPEHWQSAIDCRPRATDWQAQWYLPHARIDLAPPLAGFVGSDLLADLLACDLCQPDRPALLVDLGTNSELALWDGARLRVGSVPGGPAFEGAGLRRGMPAEPGALCAVTAEGDGFRCQRIGDTDAVRGICGSGLIDATAVLLAQGRLKPSGRFATPPGATGLALIPGEERSSLFAGDIDALQRAKAATAAAMRLLLRTAGLAWADLSRLVVCGAFGHHLNLQHARAIGLLPPLADERIELIAEAALLGCERALLAPGGKEWLGAAAQQAVSLNLAQSADYENLYIEELRLRPMALHP